MSSALPSCEFDDTQEQLKRWDKAVELREEDRERCRVQSLAEPADLLTNYGMDDDLSGAVARMIQSESMDHMREVIIILKQKAVIQAGLLIKPVEHYYPQTGP